MPKGIYERKPFTMRTRKKCSRCKELKPLSEFKIRASAPDGRQYYCHPCSNKYSRNREHTAKRREYVKAYTKTQTFKDVRRKSHAKYAKANPVKQKARVLARKYIKPKEICEVCNIKKVVHFHHPDYSMPLKVLQVCHPCHVRLHYSEGDII